MMRSELDFQKSKRVEQSISKYNYFLTSIYQVLFMCGTPSHLHHWIFIAFLKIKA